MHRARTVARPLLAVLAAALVAILATGSESLGAPTARVAALPPVVHRVTLVTGDVVRVVARAGGKRSVVLEPGADGTIPEAAISEVGDHLYVVPQTAMRLLSAHRLDLDLFDVAGLLEQRYDDARRTTIPVLVDYGRGSAAAARSRQARYDEAHKTVVVESVGAAAFSADKDRARRFWRSLTTGVDATGAPGLLTNGAVRVDLDGRVHATLEQSVGQIHAPEAWAAGYDGSGTTVAVLDTGYDPTHPDLAGRVADSESFTGEASTVDGNGHGTHVASTIAGSGAASAGVEKGVAPGAELIVGKVLDNSGSGEDSWVLAGMEWAVQHGADVVNMSLGGDVTDGTDPLSRAIDDLSASSDTLFVVAAGNNGGETTVSAPGAASSALTVGAVDASDTLAWFSSRGPRLGDGAVKPDVAAPGVGIVAARAAGTSLGSPVDDSYTSLEGTSMATPHVAGLAAILKDEHADWDGERLKAAVTASTVPVPGATSFEVGTGRVDAERAITQTVVSAPALDLGFFPYPQTSLEPVHKTLAYTNLGNEPVALTLGVAAEDPGATPPPGVSLSTSELTVPAGGQASVDVVLDPSVPSPGASSGVVVADTSDGGQVRTAFGFVLESEHYDLKVEVDPREGTQHASHLIGLLGLDTYVYEQAALAGRGRQAKTFRVPPGAYSVGVVSFGLGDDEAIEGVLDYEPLVRVTGDTTVVLDGDAAKQFGVKTDRPVVSDGQIMRVDWSGSAGFAEFAIGGSVDRLYARPLQSSDDGTVDSALNWLLSQPDAELTPAAGTSVPLRSLAAPGQSSWAVAVPELDGAYAIVDAGSAASPDSSRVRNAVALVAGRCEDLASTAAALKAAGAAAMVAYAGEGADCAGTLAQPSALPAFQARPYDAGRLLAMSKRTARLRAHASPRYVYDLAGAWPGSVPAGATLDGTSGRVASLVQQYDALGAGAGRESQVWDMELGWVGGAAAFGLVRPVAVPSVVTHYLSPVAEWEPLVEARDATGVPQALLGSPRRPVEAGQTIRDRWFGGPLASNPLPLDDSGDWRATPYREGDYFWLFMPVWTDDAGHHGFPLYLDEFDGKLYRDGELVFAGDDPLWLQGEAPPDRHAYRLVYTTHRQNGFWQRSTMTETEWTFVSSRPEGDHETAPLLIVDYELPLSDVATARANASLSFGVRLRMPSGAASSRLTRIAVEVSWDGGTTWERASLDQCAIGVKGIAGADDGCTAHIKNRAGGSASLRVTGADAAGHTVRQTVIDAYAVS